MTNARESEVLLSCTARSKAWRMPSTPEDVLADAIKPALALLLSCKWRFERASFMVTIVPFARIGCTIKDV